MPAITLVETTFAQDQARVDAERGVVREVKVLGTASKNGRRYAGKALDDLIRLLEGGVVFLDHPGASKPGRGMRSIHERFGTLRGLYKKPDGVYARELLFDTSHPYAGSFVWACENTPRGYGLSINAHTKNFRRDPDGTVVVLGIDEAHSADLVDNPATNLGLFEATGHKPTPVAGRSVGQIKDEIIEAVHGDDTAEVAARARARHRAAKIFGPTPTRPADLDRVKKELLAGLGR